MLIWNLETFVFILQSFVCLYYYIFSNQRSTSTTFSPTLGTTVEKEKTMLMSWFGMLGLLGSFTFVSSASIIQYFLTKNEQVLLFDQPLYHSLEGGEYVDLIEMLGLLCSFSYVSSASTIKIVVMTKEQGIIFNRSIY